MDFKETLATLAKLQRNRETIKKAIISEEHKQALLAQVDEAERKLSEKSNGKQK